MNMRVATRLRAALRLLIVGGHITPEGVRILERIIQEEEQW